MLSSTNFQTVKRKWTGVATLSVRSVNTFATAAPCGEISLYLFPTDVEKGFWGTLLQEVTLLYQQLPKGYARLL